MNRLARVAVIWLAAISAYAGAEDGGAVTGDEGEPLLIAQAQQPAQAQPPPPTPEQRVAMLKQWLQASQMQLRSYEWIETTVVTKGGEEKARKQNTCYYGADGKVQKVPIASGDEPESGPRGPLRRKAAAKKKKELTEYMQSAAALVQSYVPPDTNRIQNAVNSGKFSANMLEPGRRVQLEFRDYLKNGDLLAVDIELPTNRLLGMHISSFLYTAEDPIQLDVSMGVLPDGTIYTNQVRLAAPAEDIVVTIENSGYRHAAR